MSKNLISMGMAPPPEGDENETGPPPDSTPPPAPEPPPAPPMPGSGAPAAPPAPPMPGSGAPAAPPAPPMPGSGAPAAPPAPPMPGSGAPAAPPAPSMPTGGAATGRSAAPAAVPNPTPPVTGEAVPEFSEHAKSVTFTVGIPEDELPKKRIKLFYHIFKHDDVAYDELQKIVRMRTYKWVRRVYAQANLSPKIVGMEELEQPARNLLSICGILKGGEKIMPPTAAGGSSVKLKLGTDTIEVALTDTMTMGDVKDAIVSELEGTHGLTTEVKEINFSALYADEEKTVPVPPTFDIYIYEDSAMATPKEFAKNRPVDCTDRNYRDAFEVPKFELDDDDMLVGGSPSHRMALCQGASSDDQIDVYLVPKAALCGRAYPLYKDTNFSDDEQKKLLPLPELRRAAWVAYYTSDTDKRGVVFGKDWWVSPFTLAHEIDHVLADTGHNGAEGDLMMGTKWSKFNSVEAEKRIYADPILVGSPRMNLELGEGESPYITEQDMRRDLHDRRAGTGIAGVTGDVLEPW